MTSSMNEWMRQLFKHKLYALNTCSMWIIRRVLCIYLRLDSPKLSAMRVFWGLATRLVWNDEDFSRNDLVREYNLGSPISWVILKLLDITSLTSLLFIFAYFHKFYVFPRFSLPSPCLSNYVDLNKIPTCLPTKIQPQLIISRQQTHSKRAMLFFLAHL